MYTVLPQAPYGGIIRVLHTQFSSFVFYMAFGALVFYIYRSRCWTGIFIIAILLFRFLHVDFGVLANRNGPILDLVYPILTIFLT